MLDKFSSSWFKLRNRFNISTKPKIHIILYHLEDNFDDAELTLKQCTDKLVESMHQFVYKSMMKGYIIKNIDSPKHGDMLFNLVRSINCNNLKV